MSANLLMFCQNLCDESVSGIVTTASSEANGYPAEAIRSSELMTGWKPVDGTSDEYVEHDFGNATFLGSGGATAYVAIAYDARNADQTTIALRGSNDGGTGTAIGSAFTLDTTKVAVAWASFAIGTQYRYYRLSQPNSTRGGGTKCATIHYWAMCASTGVIYPAVGYTTDSEAAYEINQVNRVATVKTCGGLSVGNKWAESGQEFTVRFDPATDALFSAIQSLMPGPDRSIFIQKAGIVNPATAESFLCRATDARVSGSKQFVGQTAVSMSFETDAWL